MCSKEGPWRHPHATVGGYMTEVVYAGVDFSKETIDVALHPSGEYWQEKNDEAGRTRLEVFSKVVDRVT